MMHSQTNVKHTWPDPRQGTILACIRNGVIKTTKYRNLKIHKKLLRGCSVNDQIATFKDFTLV